MPFDFNDASRSAQRAKRRKTNIILNTLIAIVVILILIVGGSIFFGGSKSDKELAEKQTSMESAEQEGKEQVDPENAEKDNPVVDETSKEEEENTEESNDQLIEEETGEPNVEKVIINQGWKPVGTEQVGNHQRSSSKGTVDWDEQVKAVSYAVDIPVDNMTVWWLEGGENREKQAVATVAPRNNADDAYRVYIEWVDGEGWKPTEVKKLTHNDKR